MCWMQPQTRRPARLITVVLTVALMVGLPAASSASDHAGSGETACSNPFAVALDGTLPALPDYPVLAKPRMSRDGFVAVLAAHRSPAADEAGEIHDLFESHGVDPAVALAIFAKESTYGKAGRAVRNLSWGNLRSGSGAPAIDIDDGAFSIYPSWTAGAHGTAHLMVVYGENRIRPGRQTDTTKTLPYVWAPVTDNNAPDCYGDQVTAWVAAWAAQYPTDSTATGPGDPPSPLEPEYTVRVGDSLWSIAASHYGNGGDWPRIHAANQDLIGSNPSLVKAGWRLVIPMAP
jgi:hypothetical protein